MIVQKSQSTIDIPNAQNNTLNCDTVSSLQRNFPHIENFGY